MHHLRSFARSPKMSTSTKGNNFLHFKFRPTNGFYYLNVECFSTSLAFKPDSFLASLLFKFHSYAF